MGARPRRGRTGAYRAYFVQDYEAWFYPETDADDRARVKATYEMIADKIVTSAWLAERLRADGYESQAVPPGLDLDVFWPRPGDRRRRRPCWRWRGRELPAAASTPWSPRSHGARSDPGRGDRALRRAARRDAGAVPVPRRGSHHRPGTFGALCTPARVCTSTVPTSGLRAPALEAMACGAVSVLADTGGVHEYAGTRKTACSFRRGDPAAAAGAIRGCCGRDLHARLRERASPARGLLDATPGT